MPIEFRCSQCGQLLRVPEAAASKSARCPKCQALMTVPGVATALAAVGEPPAPIPASVPPAPMPPANPFSTDQPATSFPPPPMKPAADIPFASAGAPAYSENPYASPAPAAYAYGVMPGGPRPGLPWEYQGHGFSAWWETAKLCMMQPTYAFSIMRLQGGLGSPMLFCAFGLAIGVVGNLLWNLPMVIGISMLGKQEGGPDAGMLMGIQVAVQLGQAVASVVLGATIGLLIGAAVVHVCLMMVGGARQNFETTLRVLAFAQGSTAWLNVIPCVGPLAIFVWVVVLEIVGLSRAHETTGGKAALALFLPLIVIGICAVVVVVGVLGVAISAKGR